MSDEFEVDEEVTRHDVIRTMMLFALNIKLRDKMFMGVKDERLKALAQRRNNRKTARRSRRVNRLRNHRKGVR